MPKRIAVYPGTFDPFTLGHQHILQRATLLCDKLYILIAQGHHKNTLFSLEERQHMIQTTLNTLNIPITVQTLPFSGLLIHTCQNLNAKFIIRGIRNATDIEHEHQLAAINRQLDPSIETIHLISHDNLAFISSTIVKEVAKLGGDISSFVPQEIKKTLLHKICQNY
ncbi:pantetheine-phosphate adenylyltransferase [Rappaport israeli]|uniref:pantetheine-phosphate adenylyltransferase n=1 Tax=Rappaport israeli TaxID=1839807 RepID=UPI000931251F|nr:pantetheine-phosphate adenylyltransferase [Rappaport israeli]